MKRTIESISKGVDAYQSFAEKYPLAATVAETIALHGLRKVLEKAGEKGPIKLGNVLKESHIEAAVEHPVKVAMGATVIAPIKEEIAYRVAPDLVARRVKERGHEKGAKAIKAAAMIGFAAAHSGVVRPKEGSVLPEMYSDKSELSVPVSQLIGGANYQRLYDQPGRGPVHGLVAHMTNNALEVAGALPELHRRRKQRRKKA